METVAQQKWIVALSGASGMRYGIRLIDVLADTVGEVHVIISEAGIRVIREEEGLKLSYAGLSTERLFGRQCDNVSFYNPRDIGAAMASGSARFFGMAIVPSSMSTLAAVAHGVGHNLIHRAADVCLKEGRRLVIVPRETPLSSIHLENMLTLSRAGAAVVPAMPGFYHRPACLEELVDMMVMKVMDSMGIPSELVPRWKEAPSDDNEEHEPVPAVLR